MYPAGGLAEWLSAWEAYKGVAALPVDQKPYTLRMPNSVNFAFDYETFKWMSPPIYLLGTYVLMSHMLVMRKRFYLKLADNAKTKSD